MFSVKNDVDLLHDCGFLKVDLNHLIKNFKDILSKQNEKFLDYIKIEESIIENILNN